MSPLSSTTERPGRIPQPGPDMPPRCSPQTVADLAASGLPGVFDAAWGGLGTMTGADGAAWGGDVRGGVLALFFDLAAWRPWLGDAVLLLDDTERERARRKHRASDRDDLALTYALHRLVLARVLECDPGAVALGASVLPTARCRPA